MGGVGASGTCYSVAQFRGSRLLRQWAKAMNFGWPALVVASRK